MDSDVRKLPDFDNIQIQIRTLSLEQRQLFQDHGKDSKLRKQDQDSSWVDLAMSL